MPGKYSRLTGEYILLASDTNILGGGSTNMGDGIDGFCSRHPPTMTTKSSGAKSCHKDGQTKNELKVS